MREDAFKLIPGSRSLRRTTLGNNVECERHGPQYNPGSIRVGEETLAVCMDCFDLVLRNYVFMEPLVADTICQHDACCDGAGSNWCHMCERRYCTKHMWAAGHHGVCINCIEGETDTSGVRRKVESLEDQPCAHGSCNTVALSFCDQCKRYYCNDHMSAEFEHACVECTGEEDDDGAD